MKGNSECPKVLTVSLFPGLPWGMVQWQIWGSHMGVLVSKRGMDPIYCNTTARIKYSW
jgi:hypothetical protein